jgi:PsbP
MNKTTLLIVSASLYCTAMWPSLTAAAIDLPEYGFVIDAIDAAPGSGPTTALMMFLPVSDGFAPNVSVNIQPYPDSIKDYISLSKGQFQRMNLTIVEEKQTGDNEWSVEYKGPAQGIDIHFYARAVIKDGMVYLTTATAKESQWSSVGETLRKHVDSFKTK